MTEAGVLLKSEGVPYWWNPDRLALWPTRRFGLPGVR
ncbi:hypothetical protein QFZ22_009390 [Streptomyces canus]|uniref:Uncharacterized protein n=1 Tax=Streptomyces canus TaxID=58343 RepID=A0AAW8FWR1_9ACTN|nr:hypothetical protein [Streptomyces canus]